MIFINREIIPYEKDIRFDSKISEITSISITHEENLELDEIEGFFNISGDYKVNQISISKEEFNYKVPFTIELSDNIDKKSVSLDISDFTYDIKDDDTLCIKVELAFEYKEKQDRIDTLDEELDELIDDSLKEKSEDNVIDVDIVEEKEEEKEKEEREEVKEESVEETNEDFVTYHMYRVEESDTLDSICMKFKVSKETLHLYNEFSEIKMGDKLLIPKEDE